MHCSACPVVLVRIGNTTRRLHTFWSHLRARCRGVAVPVQHWKVSHEFGDWTVALYVAGSRSDSAAFCELLEAMVTRQSFSQFDARHIANLAVEERLLSIFRRRERP